MPRGGDVSEPPDCSGDISTCVEKKASRLTTLALVSTLVGFALSVLGVEKGPGWCAGIAVLSLLGLFTHVFTLSADEVTPHSGFWLALLLAACATCLHLVRAALREPAKKPGSDAAPPEAEL